MATTLDPSAIVNQLTAAYAKLPLMQKILFPLLIAGSVFGIIYVSKWASEADYAVLFSNLDATESSAVIQKLREKKIKYEVRNDGSTIAIAPPEQVHEIRIDLAGEGVPKSGKVGLDIFDKTNLGTTSFQEMIKFQRAIQGELESTIGSIEGVRSARVHVAKPEKTVFAKLGNQPTASVMLHLDRSAELSKKQIKGIANLVAGSIEGLKPENVTIVDTTGTLLSASEANEESLAVEATRLSYQREVEKGYVGRIEQMLIKVIGPEKVIARVTADIDYSQTDREEESYDPGGQVIRSQRTIEEGSGASQRGGVPGVVSNLSNDTSLLAPSGAGQEQNLRREDVKNYEVSKAISKTSSPRGKLTRLSVAVLVDGKYEALPGAAATAPKQFKALDSDVLERIESVVRSAVGFDSARGDTLTVENIPFTVPESDLTKEMEKKATVDWVFNGIYRAGPIILVAIFFLMVVRPLVRFLVTPTEAEVDLNRLLPTGIKELEQELEAERSRAVVPEFEPAVNMEQLEELMSQNSRVVKEAPHQAALLIRYWLNDGRF